MRRSFLMFFIMTVFSILFLLPCKNAYADQYERYRDTTDSALVLWLEELDGGYELHYVWDDLAGARGGLEFIIPGRLILNQ